MLTLFHMWQNLFKLIFTSNRQSELHIFCVSILFSVVFNSDLPFEHYFFKTNKFHVKNELR